MRSSSKINPEYNSYAVKKLIQIICITSLFGAFTAPSFPLFPLLLIQESSLDYFNLYQFVTSLFIVPSWSITPSFALDLFFSMSMLYTSGKAIVFAYGRKQFYSLFAIGGIASAIIATLLARSFKIPSQSFSNCFPAIVSSVTAWAMLLPYQSSPISLFVPISPRWVIAIMLFGTCGMNFLEGNYTLSIAYLAAFLFGYLYSVISFGLGSPFASLNGFEDDLRRSASKGYLFMEWNILRPVRSWIGKWK